jgi:predicted transcriptional regulator
VREAKVVVRLAAQRYTPQSSPFRELACSVIRATMLYMATAPPPLSIRLGSDGLAALDEIARCRGVSRAEATRQAIAETAQRDRRRTGLAAEARRLMEDPAYRDEAQQVARLMEELRGPW